MAITLLEVVKLLRVHQWMKNLFIFLPLFFGKKFISFSNVSGSLTVFFAFSLTASAVYCFNDIRDIEKDRLHPDKSKRPLASGTLSIRAAYIVLSICLISSLLILFLFVEKNVAQTVSVISLYLVMNIFYTMVLKRFAIIDVLIIAFGFILRIISGGVSSDTILSPWIILMTFLLALFLAFAKRRDDLILRSDLGIDVRTNTNTYNKNFVDVVLSILAAIIFVCYMMYAMSEDVQQRFQSKYVYVTSLFILVGLLRYLQITLVEQKSGNPTRILLKDRFLQIAIISWIVSFYSIIYT